MYFQQLQKQQQTHWKFNKSNRLTVGVISVYSEQREYKLLSIQVFTDSLPLFANSGSFSYQIFVIFKSEIHPVYGPAIRRKVRETL
jgi:hypothetical protein